jgi:hypothetical protein
LIARGFDPCAVRVDRVSRDADDLGADALQLVDTVRKGRQLCRADESKIERVKDLDEPFALIIRELTFSARVSIFFVDGRSKSGAGLPTFAMVVATPVSVAVPVAVAMCSVYLLE